MKPGIITAYITTDGRQILINAEREDRGGAGVIIKPGDGVFAEDIQDAVVTLTTLAGIPYRDPVKEGRRRHAEEHKEARVEVEINKILGGPADGD